MLKDFMNSARIIFDCTTCTITVVYRIRVGFFLHTHFPRTLQGSYCMHSIRRLCIGLRTETRAIVKSQTDAWTPQTHLDPTTCADTYCKTRL